MKNKIIYLTLLNALLLALMNVNAQTSPGLKKFTPPSPNASALGKYGEIPVSLYSGIPNISIPIYNLKGRELELPISLSYHAAGIKVEEIASWVGLGWSLNAGGVITRGVRGYPDDIPSGYFGSRTTMVSLAKKYITNLDPTTSYGVGLGNADQADLQTLEQIKDQAVDAEPDIFYFNFGKYSGEFFMNENGQFSVSPIQPLQITYQYISGINTNQIAKWTITTPDGVQYIFGTSLDGQRTAIEKNDNAALHGIVSTGWYLLDVKSPNNDVINLDYTTIAYNYINKSSETINLIVEEAGSQPAHLPSFDKNIVTNYMTVPLLKSVTSCNGKITLDAPNSRTDLPGDKSLSQINIFSNSDLINPQKKYSFNYNYSNGGRLTLISIDEFSSANIPSGNKYQFEYNPTQLPNSDPNGTAINSQDLWGYYNGVYNTVLPQTFYITSQAYGTTTIDGSDRHSDESHMQAGVLTKIIYPTGGSSLFEYEANKVYTISNNSIPSAPTGKGSSLQYLTGQTVSKTFVITDATIGGGPGTTPVTVIASAMGSTPGCQISPASGYSTCYTASIVGVNGTNFPIQYFKDGTSTIYLSNGSYKIVGKGELVQGYPNASYNFYLNLSWNEYPPAGSDPNAMVEKTVGGLRIKRITNNTNSGVSVKRYVYSKFIDGTPSGVLVNNPFHYANIFELMSGCGTTVYAQIRSYPLLPMLQTQGSSIGYENVTELDGENGENGKTEFSYTTANQYPDEIKEYRPYPQSCSYDWRRGLLLKSTAYINANGTFVPVKSVTNTYSFNNNSSIGYGVSVETGIGIVTDPSCVYYPGLTASAYYVSGYKTIGEFYYLQSKTTKIYDQKNPSSYSQSISNYSYDLTKGHYQLTSTVTQDSKNGTVESVIKYPQDVILTGTAEIARQNLISNFMLNSVIDQISYKNGVQNKKLRNNYKVFSNGFVLPESTELQIASNPSEKRVEFLSYDAYGNVTQQHKMSDVLNSYIWDYNGALLTAEVINADPSAIAHTSFEADGSGSWNIGSTTRLSNDGVTGSKYYQLSNGAIIKTGLITGTKYIVSYWTRNITSLTINGTTGIKGRVFNGWTYFQHLITLSGTTITIPAVSATIDELRLYPAAAQMTTYTYSPLVGMTSQCDANNRITYYEYDSFGRLILIRDQDMNILKSICYNYSGQPGNCTIFGNQVMLKTIRKNDCTGCQAGSYVTYTVPVNTYFGTSQDEANALAAADLDANAQDFANVNGSCSTPGMASLVSTNSILNKSFTVVFHNNCTNSNYNYTLNQNTSNVTLSPQLPSGNYNVSLAPVGGSTTSYSYWVNGFVAYGTTGNILGVDIVSGSNQVRITP